MKGDSNNFFSQVSVLQPQGTCSCYSRSDSPDIAQKTFQSGVDGVIQVPLDFTSGLLYYNWFRLKYIPLLRIIQWFLS